MGEQPRDGRNAKTQPMVQIVSYGLSSKIILQSRGFRLVCRLRRSRCGGAKSQTQPTNLRAVTSLVSPVHRAGQWPFRPTRRLAAQGTCTVVAVFFFLYNDSTRTPDVRVKKSDTASSHTYLLKSLPSSLSLSILLSSFQFAQSAQIPWLPPQIPYPLIAAS